MLLQVSFTEYRLFCRSLLQNIVSFIGLFKFKSGDVEAFLVRVTPHVHVSDMTSCVKTSRVKACDSSRLRHVYVSDMMSPLPVRHHLDVSFFAEWRYLKITHKGDASCTQKDDVTERWRVMCVWHTERWRILSYHHRRMTCHVCVTHKRMMCHVCVTHRTMTYFVISSQ